MGEVSLATAFDQIETRIENELAVDFPNRDDLKVAAAGSFHRACCHD